MLMYTRSDQPSQSYFSQRNVRALRCARIGTVLWIPRPGQKDYHLAKKRTAPICFKTLTNWNEALLMSEIQLYHGSGNGYSPDPRHLECLISKRLKARGFSSVRHGETIIYTSTCRKQSEQYTDTADGLFIVSPEAGALITWMPGVADLILDLESYLRRRCMNDRYIFKGKDLGTFLNDTCGNVTTIDVYLSRGRQVPAVSRMIDTFLDLHPPMEMKFSVEQGLEALKDHQGEVIIQGGFNMSPAKTAAMDHAEPSSLWP